MYSTSDHATFRLYLRVIGLFWIAMFLSGSIRFYLIFLVEIAWNYTFCSELQSHCTALSQSESSNFSHLYDLACNHCCWKQIRMCSNHQWFKWKTMELWLFVVVTMILYFHIYFRGLFKYESLFSCFVSVLTFSFFYLYYFEVLVGECRDYQSLITSSTT